MQVSRGLVELEGRALWLGRLGRTMIQGFANLPSSRALSCVVKTLHTAAKTRFHGLRVDLNLILCLRWQLLQGLSKSRVSRSVVILQCSSL